MKHEGLIVCLFSLVFIGCVCGGAVACEAATCHQVGAMSGRRVQFKLIGGCFVEVNGRLIPQGSWRGEEDR